MKFSKIAAVLSLSLFVCASASAEGEGETLPAKPSIDNNASVTKKVTLTAQISDTIFVSKPDGSSWYNTEELEAEDYSQKKFSKTLPVRVQSKSKDFTISLAQPLTLSNGNYEMKNLHVTLGTPKKNADLDYGNSVVVSQDHGGNGTYDNIYNVQIKAEAPDVVEDSEVSEQGTYSGELVMLFEPGAATTN